MSSAVHGYYLRADWGRVAKDLRVSFEAPGSTPIAGSGLQEIRARVKGSDPLGGDVGGVLELWESGVLKATLASGFVSVSGTTLSGTWNSSLLTDSSGAGVEVRLTSDGGINNGIAIEALEWNAALPVSEIVGGGVASDELAGSVTANPGVASIPLYQSGDYPTEDYPQEDYPADYLAPTPLGSEETVGTLTAQESPGIQLIGVGSEESVGTLTASPGPASRALAGVNSEELTGALSAVAGNTSLALSGVGTEEDAGALTATPGTASRTLTGVASDELAGVIDASPASSGNTVILRGPTSDELVGILIAVGPGGDVTLVGVPSDELVGVLVASEVGAIPWPPASRVLTPRPTRQTLYPSGEARTLYPGGEARTLTAPASGRRV